MVRVQAAVQLRALVYFSSKSERVPDSVLELSEKNWVKKNWVKKIEWKKKKLNTHNFASNVKQNLNNKNAFQ